ncbi:hypothetical protein NL491_27855, partial [Klebsiella pneumoniae]|nr:hypothetical protein [Klebsiella pneumoniae]
MNLKLLSEEIAFQRNKKNLAKSVSNSKITETNLAAKITNRIFATYIRRTEIGAPRVNVAKANTANVSTKNAQYKNEMTV